MRAWSSLALTLPSVALLAAACGASSSSTSSDGRTAQDDSCAGPCPASKIRHLIVLIQENHTFDDHLGGWCKAAPGSNPSCTAGPSCCEGMPAADPAGIKPTVLTDAEHGAYDPPHDAACETAMMNGGKMDAYGTATVPNETCGNPQNVAASDPSIIAPFWALASAGAVADRYFQPVVGQSYANDMFLARARYLFADDTVAPAGAVGVTCGIEATQETLTGTTIGDLLTSAHVPWTFYAEGYAAMKAADGGCPPRPSDCPFLFPFDPCGFEPSDVPFEYFASTRDNPATMKDYTALQDALASGGLPAVSFVKALEYKTEHPGDKVTASAGIAFVTALAQQVSASRYAADTLLLVTYDEGGGYFDHVTPPPANPVDMQPYGTRVPLVASGPFAAAGTVSHVVLEHSSIVKFIEWNFLGGVTGQLQARDAVVANLGSLLDPAATGVPVPMD